MSRPTIPVCIDEAARRPAGPGLAALGLLLVLLPAAALSADPQQDQPAEKKPPARPAPAPLRFTDEDLEKYHKPKAAEPEEPSGEESGPGERPAGAPPTDPQPPSQAPGPPKTSPVRPRPTPSRTPPRAAKPPAEDPLKPWKDRDALETFRHEQLESLRQKIAALQSRLDYLNTKRGALANPNPVQPGSTGTRAFQYDENGNPVYQADPSGNPVLDPNGKPIPVSRPSIAPGRGQPKMLPIFPALPEPQSDQDREDDKRMKVKDLLEKVEDEIETVEEELGRARKDLIAVETRFEQEMAPR